MSNTHAMLALGAQLPVLLTVGAVAVAIPILVHLLIKRRTVLFQWGAMQLLLEAVQRRGRMRLLRLLLLLVRMAVPVCAAAALAGIWFDGIGSTSRPWSIVLLDDTIGSFVKHTNGHRAIDTHLAAIAKLKQQGPIQVVALSGRPLPRELLTLEPIAAGPNWSGALQSVARRTQESRHADVLLLSELRVGVLPDEGTLQQTGVKITFHPPAVDDVDTIRIVRVHAPRAVLLPGDPFEQGHLEVDLVRDGSLPSQRSTLLLFDDTGVELDQHEVHWHVGESSRLVQIPLPTSTTHTQFQVQSKPTVSPASTRWITLQQRTSAEITVITDTHNKRFNAASDTSWLDLAVLSGAPNGAMRVRHVFPQDLLIEALPKGMPVVVTIPEAIPTATWSAMLTTKHAGQVLVLPPPDADSNWLQTLLESVDPDFDGPLRAIAQDRILGTMTLADDLGPLELIRAELPTLLGSVQIEHMINLERLVEANVGDALVSLGKYPVFLRLHNAPVVISALSWHPTWSDLPLRPAGPALLQELLRAELGQRERVVRTASGPGDLQAGMRADGVLIQPDATAAQQTPLLPSTIKKLQDAGWTPTQGSSIASAHKDVSWIFALALVVLVITESVLARCIDMSVRQTGAQPA